MKIMFIPHDNKNFYQTNLSNSLARYGANVCYDQGNVIRSVIKDRPDVLHVHWPDPFMIADSKMMTIFKSTRFISGLLALKLCGIRIVWTVHNIGNHEEKFKSEELIFNKSLAKLCDKLIVHCDSAKIDIEEKYGKSISEKTVVIPHGNYIDSYQNKINSLNARNDLSLNRDDLVFLYFGAIRQYKGLPEFIDIFKKLDDARIKLIIAGKPLSSDIKSDVLNKCKDDVRIKSILEFIPNDDVQKYFNAADIVILPYKNILASGVAILAMSFGKPIVAPKIKCIADTLDDKGSFLYNDENLFDTIQKVVKTDKTILMNMGKHNLQLAEKLSWDEIGKKTFDLYKACLAG